MNKNIIRKSILQKRDNISTSFMNIASRQIAQHLFSMNLFWELQTVMTYVNIKKEVATRDIIIKSLQLNKQVAVPVCIPETSNLLAARINNINELVRGYMGLWEPLKNNIHPLHPNIIDIILVPAIAVDCNGNRLGYGKGYYDRFLINVRTDAVKIALVYSFQVISHVPTNSFDIPMDFIITEKGIIKVKHTPRRE